MDSHSRSISGTYTWREQGYYTGYCDYPDGSRNSLTLDEIDNPFF